MSFWRRRDLATPRPIGSNAALPVSQEPEDSSREWYIRTLVAGYRKGDMPIPGWLQTEWDDLGLVDPDPPPPVNGELPEGVQVQAVFDRGSKLPLERRPEMPGYVFGGISNMTGTVTAAAVLDAQGSILCLVKMNEFWTRTGDEVTVTIDDIRFNI